MSTLAKADRLRLRAIGIEVVDDIHSPIEAIVTLSTKGMEYLLNFWYERGEVDNELNLRLLKLLSAYRANPGRCHGLCYQAIPFRSYGHLLYGFAFYLNSSPPLAMLFQKPRSSEISEQTEIKWMTYPFKIRQSIQCYVRFTPDQVEGLKSGKILTENNLKPCD